MSTIMTYRLRAASASELHALLVAASAGKPRAYAWADVDEPERYDEARVRRPFAETAPGLPVADVETGNLYTPEIPTGFWLCEVMLVDDIDAGLAQIAIEITTA